MLGRTGRQRQSDAAAAPQEQGAPEKKQPPRSPRSLSPFRKKARRVAVDIAALDGSVTSVNVEVRPRDVQRAAGDGHAGKGGCGGLLPAAVQKPSRSSPGEPHPPPPQLLMRCFPPPLLSLLTAIGDRPRRLDAVCRGM